MHRFVQARLVSWSYYFYVGLLALFCITLFGSTRSSLHNPPSLPRIAWLPRFSAPRWLRQQHPCPTLSGTAGLSGSYPSLPCSSAGGPALAGPGLCPADPAGRHTARRHGLRGEADLTPEGRDQPTRRPARPTSRTAENALRPGPRAVPGTVVRLARPTSRPARPTSRTAENAPRYALRTGGLGGACAGRRRPALCPACAAAGGVWGGTRGPRGGPACGARTPTLRCGRREHDASGERRSSPRMQIWCRENSLPARSRSRCGLALRSSPRINLV